MSKLSHKLSSTAFLISQLTILVIALGGIAGIYFFINNNKVTDQTSQLFNTITREPSELTLTLSSPEDNQLIFEDQVLVSGKLLGASQVLISSNFTDQVINAKKDGSFSTEFDLKEGVNNIIVTTFDVSGEQKSISKTIYYSKEKI